MIWEVGEDKKVGCFFLFFFYSDLRLEIWRWLGRSDSSKKWNAICIIFCVMRVNQGCLHRAQESVETDCSVRSKGQSLTSHDYSESPCLCVGLNAVLGIHPWFSPSLRWNTFDSSDFFERKPSKLRLINDVVPLFLGCVPPALNRSVQTWKWTYESIIARVGQSSV